MKTFLALLKEKSRQFILPIYFFRRFGLGQNQMKILKTFLLAGLFEETSDQVSLEAAVSWLISAHGACKGRGISAKFSVRRGWDVAYPETSGYILVTLHIYGELYNKSDILDRAVQIGNWEIDIQTDAGGVLSTPLSEKTRIFNTGQVILGWCHLYEKTGKEKYLAAAVKAAEYIGTKQEKDGSWVQDTFCGPRTYHARVDWALLKVAHLSGQKALVESAVDNLNWVVSNQNKNGWFNNCGFGKDLPNMHVISYTLRGLFECDRLNKIFKLEEISELNLTSRLLKATDELCVIAEHQPLFGISGMLPTSYDKNWRSFDRHACLTGNAQFACLLYRVHQVIPAKGYKRVADTIMEALKRTQIKFCEFPEINGAIAGSYPFHSGYLNRTFPNWATKFFIDGLIMKNQPQTDFNIPA